MASPLFDVPAASMPVATEVGLQLGGDHQMAFARLDRSATPRTDIPLAGGVRLYGGDDFYPERAAHASRAAVIRRVPTTKAKSTAVFRCVPKGLRPMMSW